MLVTEGNVEALKSQRNKGIAPPKRFKLAFAGKA